MSRSRVLAGALGLALALGICAEAARAGLAALILLDYAPSLTAPLGRYPFKELATLDGVRMKLARQCALFPDRRGVKLQASADGGTGTFLFGVPVGSRFDLSAGIDASRLRTPGSFAGVEFRTPAVAEGARSLFAGVRRNGDGTLTAFAEDTGTPIGTEVDFASDEDCLTLGIAVADGKAQVSAAFANGPVSIAEDHAFAIEDAGGFGAGISAAAKGDAMTVSLDAQGLLYDEATGDVLIDLFEAIGEQLRAQRSLERSLADDAKQSLQDADAILAQGRPIPDSEPPIFTGALIPRAQALYPDDALVGRQIEKQITKARAEIAAALALVDEARLPEAAAALDAAIARAERAKAIVETGVAGEKPTADPTAPAL